MNKEELNILINDYKINKCEESYKKILKEHNNLINSIVKKYLAFAEYDDLYQSANLGLIKAIELFDKEKGFKFSTFAYQLILNEVGLTARKNKKHKYYKNKKIGSLDTYIISEEEKNTFLNTLTSDDNIEEYIMKKYKNEFLNSCINEYKIKYPEKFKAIELILNSINYRDAGKMLNCSRQTICNRYQEFIKFCIEKNK